MKRTMILSALHSAMSAYNGESWKLIDINKLNQQYLDSSRGKGKARGMIKSIAMAKNNATYFPPEKRNGAKECARRLRQMSI